MDDNEEPQRVDPLEEWHGSEAEQEWLVYLAELQSERDCNWFVKRFDYVERHHGPGFYESLSDADQDRLLRELDRFIGESFPEDGSWLLDLLQ